MDATAGGNNTSTIETVLETLWAPETLNYVPGSASELEQNLKLSGIKLRRELLMSAQNDFDSWATLMTPPSIHEASRTLTQMLLHLPTVDRDNFIPLGDNSVSMPLFMGDGKILLPHNKAHGSLS
jgi:hypothetical protein